MGVPYFLVGHVGDGNFHFGYLIDPHEPEQRERAELLNARLVARAIRLDGTCSGEHGIGMHKMDFLMQEAGLPAVELMRAIKRAFDPQNILNPGKVLWGAAEQGALRRSWAPGATF
jgi:D-lactate dehydrogenase (cytochrome)